MGNEYPDSLWGRIEPLLPLVERPSRYLGCEWNSPSIGRAEVSVVLAYPDVYEIGSSHLGLSILQEIVNGIPGTGCERAFSPWTDMESQMRSAGIPLFSLETHRPVGKCDIFGITLPHELSYTNVLNLIDLAGIPLRSDRRKSGPLVVGGGCCAANPEPLAPFLDLVVLGEAEETIGELVELVRAGKSGAWNRNTLLDKASRLKGVYRPSDYHASYNAEGLLESVTHGGGKGHRPVKRVADLQRWLYPRRPVVPFCETVHNRANLEVFRGCSRGCRFCQAGMIYRPVRERSPADIVEMAEKLVRSTGHEELSLCSLSSTDYMGFQNLVDRLGEVCRAHSVKLTVPSLRIDSDSLDAVLGLGGSRGGLTFAPEAGSARLRSVINKPIGEGAMADALIRSSRSGIRLVKLYFMIGLPTETDGDVEAIADTVFRLRDAVRSEGLPPPALNVSVSTFVPKPHTPFQWEGQCRHHDVLRRQDMLKRRLRVRGLNLSWHDAEMSMIEGLLARGDRRLSGAIERVWRKGQRFDAWSEHFSLENWESALEEEGLDLDFYLYRQRKPDELFPWDHLDFGVDRDFLYREYRKGLQGRTSPDCRGGECLGCGACPATGWKPTMTGAWRRQ